MQAETLIRTLIEEAFNKGNLAVLETLIHPEYQYVSPDSRLNGIAQLTDFIQGFRSAFPDLSIHIDDIFATDERSCTAFTLKGTHQQDFMGIPATGKPVEVKGMVMSRMEDNKIVAENEILDNLTFLQQLGVVPELA